MTKLLYMDDSYLKECEAIVEEIDNCRIVLDQTIFYPQGGGVPFDTGKIFKGGEEFVVSKVKKEDGKIIHYVDREGLKQGDTIHCKIDWDRRYKLMKYHTAAHVLAGTLNTDTGALITGNQIDLDKTRFDFNLENFDREILEKQIEKANSYFETDIPISVSYMLREEALRLPGMVKLAGVLPPEVKELRIVKIGDVGAYAIGKSIGKTKLAIHVSPKKTVEGALGGLLFSVVSAIIVGISMKFSIIQSIIFAIVLSVVGQLGDLAESLLKRVCDVKDAGESLPGLGGMLDIMDSLLFAAPVFYYMIILKG